MDRTRTCYFLVAFAILYFCEVQCARKVTGMEIFGFYKIENLEVANCTNHTSDKIVFISNIDYNVDGQISLNVNITVLEDVESLTGKFRIFKKLKQNKQKQLMSVNIPNFCEYMLKDMPQAIKASSSKGCQLPKGVYDNLSVDIVTYARTLLGRKFFYGYYGAEVQIFSDKQVVICIECTSDLVNPRSTNG